MADSIKSDIEDIKHAIRAGFSPARSSRDSSSGELFEPLRLELRRGCLVIAVLAQLGREHCGYTLRKSLVEAGLEIEESTLYPLLRRLESQGLLTSEWREEEKRNKRFYRLSEQGEAIRKALLAEWTRINESIGRIVDDKPL